MAAIIRHCASVLALSLTTVGPARSQPAETPKSEPRVDCGTGFVFPANAGGLFLPAVTKQEAQRCVKQVSYKKLYLRSRLLISIEPGGDAPCAELFAREDARTVEFRPFFKPDPDGRPLHLLGPSVQQHTARYIEPGSHVGRDSSPETRQTLWIGCIGPNNGETATWFIRYLEYYDAADEAEVAGLAEKLFAAIDWSPLLGE